MSNKRSEEELRQILKKYINDQASPAERGAVDAWYDALDYTEQLPIKETARLPVWAAIAALLLVTMTATLLFFNAGNTTGNEILISTSSNERKSFTLSDGTEIMLNRKSQVRISGDFGDKNRIISLEGEAWFRVAKDSIRPFIVESGSLRTTVLGTSFNINAYEKHDRFKVAVLTGKVRVSEIVEGKEKILADQLTTNHTLSFYKQYKEAERNMEDAAAITSWKENKLYIDNASISDIASQLSNFYQTDVRILTSFNAKDRYTIRFNKESVSGAMEVLTLLTQKQFNYEKNKITIK